MILNPENLRRIGFGVVGFVAGFLFGTFVLTIPTPTVTDARNVDGFVILKGTTRPDAVVVAFDPDWKYLATSAADDAGNFLFEGLPYSTGTTYMIRAMKGKWLASAARKVSNVMSVDRDAPEIRVTGDDLPPGVPPTSSARSTEGNATTTSSTRDAKPPEILIATASVSDMNPTAGTSVRLTVKVRDEKGAPLDGVRAKAAIHYPAEGVEAELTGRNGTYSGLIKVPADVAPGTTVIIDIYTTFDELSSTARAAFTVK